MSVLIDLKLTASAKPNLKRDLTEDFRFEPLFCGLNWLQGANLKCAGSGTSGMFALVHGDS
ncbi:MAG: hypothetical protein HYV60_03660 [Planctomycetia bacterium]|nr:hypothetical protein [Planctomycetia bacterium]